jgi:hypothetical protein
LTWNASQAEDDAPAEEKVDEEASAGNGLEATPAANEEPGKPRPLHRTCSIFLRNLAPNITKQEVEAVSRWKYPQTKLIAVLSRWIRQTLKWIVIRRILCVLVTIN